MHVLTGFLGSGKTTVLNRLLTQPGMEYTAVIVNELGTVGIDHLLVEARTEDIMMLAGGCLCCSVRSDLVETLLALHAKRARGEIPPFCQVLVETTGLADPAPVLRVLLNDPDIPRHFRLGQVITTVDGVYGAQQLAEHDESAKQAALASVLIVTKTDLPQAKALDTLQQRLRRLNPGAPLLDANRDRLDAATLLACADYDPHTRQLDATGWLQAECYPNAEEETWPAPARHDAFIRAFCLEWPEPLPWRVLERWIQQLTRLRGKDLLRVKGIVHTVETELPVVIQGVQHIFQPPSTLRQWPEQPPRTRIVFITRNIPRELITAHLHELTQAATPQQACLAAQRLLAPPSL